MKFRQKSPELPKAPVEYPLGTFIHTEKGYFYIASADKRYRCLSKRVLDSWSPHRVVETSEAAVSKYRVVAKLKFRNGSLIWSLGDGRLYLIESGLRRPIYSPDALTRIGAKMSDAVTVSVDEVKLHELGKDLT